MVLFYGLLVFLTFNKHSHSGYYNYHSEIWADKAGYYVYLPAAFKYNFKADQFPNSIDNRTGNGFKLNLTTNSVETKYTYGVSLLQSPFYLVADLISNYTEKESDGFSPIYHAAINFAAITYFFLAILLLYHILLNTFNQRTVIFVLLSIFLGTNLYYYVISATGMSHVYSFFLISLLLYILYETDFLSNSKLLGLFSFGLVSGLIILVRPTNFIVLSVFFFVSTNTTDSVLKRLQTLSSLKTIVPIVIGVTIIILPQLLYWKLAFGTVVSYSYQDEGFNWTSPQLLSIWFSPNNGLFLYGSMYIIILYSLFVSTFRNTSYWFYLILFVMISYITASWWVWSFGCSYGGRNFVEYLAVFSIPLGSFYHNTKNKKLLSLIVLVVIILNLKLIYTFDDCYFGVGNWDWSFYWNLIIG